MNYRVEILKYLKQFSKDGEFHDLTDLFPDMDFEKLELFVVDLARNGYIDIRRDADLNKETGKCQVKILGRIRFNGLVHLSSKNIL